MSSTSEEAQAAADTGVSVEQQDAKQETVVENKSENNVQVDETEEKPKINKKNWLNLGAYVLNIVFTFGVGTNGWFGNGTNGELSQKYQVRIRTCVVSLLSENECTSLSLANLLSLTPPFIPIPSHHADYCDTEIGCLSHLDFNFSLAGNLCHCPISPKIPSDTHGAKGSLVLVLSRESLSSRLDLFLCLRNIVDVAPVDDLYLDCTMLFAVFSILYTK